MGPQLNLLDIYLLLTYNLSNLRLVLKTILKHLSATNTHYPENYSGFFQVATLQLLKAPFVPLYSTVLLSKPENGERGDSH